MKLLLIVKIKYDTVFKEVKIYFIHKFNLLITSSSLPQTILCN